MQDHEYVHNKQKINVGAGERLVSLVLGTAAVYNSLSKKKKSLAALLAGGYLLYRGLTGNCKVYSLMGLPYLPDPEKNINIRRVIQVNRPRGEVYAFWRRLENLPLFMQHLESVETSLNGESRWVAQIPGGLGTVTWLAQIVHEVPGESLGWSSLPGADIENAGKVEFRDTENGGTELHVNITYRPPMGDLGTAVANLLNPLFEKMVTNDIENYVLYMEKGNVPFIHNLHPAS